MASMVRCLVGCNVGSADVQALHVVECDTETGAAKLVQSVKGVEGTTYFQFSPDGSKVFASIAEQREGQKRGALVSFDIAEGRVGAMTRLADLPCENPCHIALSPDGSRISFAAYLSGTAGTCSVAPTANGVRALAYAVLPDDAMGPVTDRQQKAYAHCCFFTPDGARMGVIDLGCDRIRFYEPNTMTPDPALAIRFDAGDGPRHAVWSKDNRFLFVICELGNAVVSFAYDGKSFTRVGKWSTLPQGCTTWSKAAAIKLTDDGKILMASNRGHDSIAFFAVDTQRGTLTPRTVQKLTGAFPRDFELLPGEKFMIVGHKKSNAIQVYRFDRDALTIAPVGEPIAAWLPLCFKFMTAVR